MEEKVIVKSEQYNNEKIMRKISVIGLGFFFLGFLVRFFPALEGLSFIAIIIAMALGFIVVFLSRYLRSYELTVTDKRIYGKTSFGKRVDLPMDSVSAVATTSLNGIAIATSSGRIVFKLIKNRDEIHSKLSELLIERQNKRSAETVAVKQEIFHSNADELKKYKELLDLGVISQEEFDAKKKQLLGL